MTLEQQIRNMLEEIDRAKKRLEAVEQGTWEHRVADDTLHHLRYTFVERLQKLMKEGVQS